MTSSNKTFTDGPNFHLNACVGENTGGDSDYGYVKGFAQAVFVLLSAAQSETFADPVTGEADWAYMDALIYPIGFCARHYIELFLKRQIRVVGSIRKQKAPAEAKGHDLSSLWGELVAACSTDRRLAVKLQPMAEYVNDFASIDSTGQTFRYQHDAESGVKHLKKMGRINLQGLAKRFKELEGLAEDFDNYSAGVAYEYSWGTYTSKLSRADLYEIAERLPHRSDWGGDEFCLIAQELKNTFSLGSNDFSRAIKLIQSHREFSAMVGVEIPLDHISAEVFERIKNFDPRTRHPIEFSRQELAVLNAIYEASPPHEYSEAYDHVFADSLSSEFGRALLPSDVVRTIRNHSIRFRKGLAKLGQKTLLSAFELTFTPEPEPSEQERQKAMEHYELDIKSQLESLILFKPSKTK